MAKPETMYLCRGPSGVDHVKHRYCAAQKIGGKWVDHTGENVLCTGWSLTEFVELKEVDK